MCVFVRRNESRKATFRFRSIPPRRLLCRWFRSRFPTFAKPHPRKHVQRPSGSPAQYADAPSAASEPRVLHGAAFAARLAPRRHRSGIPGDRSAGRPPAAVARPCRPAVRYRAGAFSQAPRRRPKWQTVLVEIVHVAPAPLHVDASGAWDGSHGAFASVDMEEGTCVGLYLGDALRKVQADQLSAARKPYDAGNKTGQPYRDELISQGATAAQLDDDTF